MSRLLARSLTGALLIGVILLMRALLGRRLPRRAFVILWGTAALHLLLPRLPAWPLSIWSLWRRLPPAQTIAGTAIGTAPAGRPEVLLTEPAEMTGAAAGQGMLFWIWLWGAAAVAGFFLLTYLWGRLRFADAVPADIPGVEAWRQARPMRRVIRVRQSRKIVSPITFGLVRPVILLPCDADWSREGLLACVLAHEEAHIRFGDLWCKVLLALTLSVYWFHPAVWLLYVLAQRDMELACDQSALRTLGFGCRARYALALLAMAETRASAAPLSGGFSKTALEARIEAIMKTKNYTRAAMAAAILLCCCITAVFASDGRSARAADPTPAGQTTELPQTHREALTMAGAEVDTEGDTEIQAADLWYWPCPTGNVCTATFGRRVHPVTGQEMVCDHVVIAAQKDILAARDGVVTEAAFDPERGNTVTIDHGDGVQTVYGHLEKQAVAVGDPVFGGQVIGTAGKTGMATGECLAFWGRVDGAAVDPMTYYPQLTAAE